MGPQGTQSSSHDAPPHCPCSSTPQCFTRSLRKARAKAQCRATNIDDQTSEPLWACRHCDGQAGKKKSNHRGPPPHAPRSRHTACMRGRHQERAQQLLHGRSSYPGRRGPVDASTVHDVPALACSPQEKKKRKEKKKAKQEGRARERRGTGPARSTTAAPEAANLPSQHRPKKGTVGTTTPASAHLPPPSTKLGCAYRLPPLCEPRLGAFSALSLLSTLAVATLR